MHWENAFLAFKIAHFSFYGFWLNIYIYGFSLTVLRNKLEDTHAAKDIFFRILFLKKKLQSFAVLLSVKGYK